MNRLYLKSYFLLGCNEIEVTSTRGSNSQQCRTGVYRIYPETFNQKPTFKHESKQEYLYYMNKGKGFWMVKTTMEPFEISTDCKKIQERYIR